MSYRAKQRVAEFTKEAEVDRKRIDKISVKITDALAKKGDVDKCIAAVNDRLAKVHAAKDDAPAAIPEGATLICDTTAWQTGCTIPTVFASNTAFVTVEPCGDPASTETQALQDVSSKKPYSGSTEIDGWAKQVNTAIAARDKAIASLKMPGVIAAISNQCDATALESFVDETTGNHRQLEAYTCKVTLTWTDPTGNSLGRLKATGRGNPPDTARNASTLSESEMTSANLESQNKALDDGWTQIQKRIDAVNKKGGTVPKSAAPAPAAPKSAAPAAPKPATPAPKPTTPAPKPTTSAPKPPPPAPKKK